MIDPYPAPIPWLTPEPIDPPDDPLPDPQVREDLDFIGYLKQRSERAEWVDLMEAQASALSDVWDNQEDDVWNDV